MSGQDESFSWGRLPPTLEAFTPNNQQGEGSGARQQDHPLGASVNAHYPEWGDQFLNLPSQGAPELGGHLPFDEPQQGFSAPPETVNPVLSKSQIQPSPSEAMDRVLSGGVPVTSRGEREGGARRQGEGLPGPPPPEETIQPVPTMEELKSAYQESWGYRERPKPWAVKAAPESSQLGAREPGKAKVEAAAIIRGLFQGATRAAPLGPSIGPSRAREASIPPVTGNRLGASSKSSEAGSGTLGEGLEPVEAIVGFKAPARETVGQVGSRPDATLAAASRPLEGGTISGPEPPPQEARLSDPQPRDNTTLFSAPQNRELDSSEREGVSIAQAIVAASRQVALAMPISDLDEGLPLFDPAQEDTQNDTAVEAQRTERTDPDEFAAVGFEWLLEGDALAEGEQASIGENMADPTLRSPLLHRLWADLSPSEVRRARFQTFREAYREEVRRLRVWTATYAGQAVLPQVAELHYLACNALPGLSDRHARMMLTKGALWSAFVRHSLDEASPADLYFARHDGQRVYRGESGRWLLSKMTPEMQDRCLYMCFVMEDLKDEAAYGPETFRAYKGLHKSGGLARPPPKNGYAYRQITFPELEALSTSFEHLSTEQTIQFSGDPIFNEDCFTPKGMASRWGSFWNNRGALMASARGLSHAGARARDLVADFAELAMDGHVARFDSMAAGGSPGSVEKYLEFAKDEAGWKVSFALAFCAIGQSLADEKKWEPTADGVNKLFEGTRRGLELAANVMLLTSDLRTYQADLIQGRLNAVAISMREKHCSQSKANEVLTARVATEVNELACEVAGRVPGSDPVVQRCWQLLFDCCRTSVALLTDPESGFEHVFEV